ncbi:MAG: hypothetical protein VW455_02660 [Nitrospinota bacterium]
MTTIILVIIALAIAAGVVSKMVKKDSPGTKGSKSSNDSQEKPGRPKLRDPNQAKKAKAMVDKAIQMSP